MGPLATSPNGRFFFLVRTMHTLAWFAGGHVKKALLIYPDPLVYISWPKKTPPNGMLFTMGGASRIAVCLWDKGVESSQLDAIEETLKELKKAIAAITAHLNIWKS